MVLSDVIKILFVSETDDVEEFGVPLGLIFFFSWRYNPHLGVVFYSPLAGFSLLAYEVS